MHLPKAPTRALLCLPGQSGHRPPQPRPRRLGFPSNRVSKPEGGVGRDGRGQGRSGGCRIGGVLLRLVRRRAFVRLHAGLDTPLRAAGVRLDRHDFLSFLRLGHVRVLLPDLREVGLVAPGARGQGVARVIERHCRAAVCAGIGALAGLLSSGRHIEFRSAPMRELAACSRHELT